MCEYVCACVHVCLCTHACMYVFMRVCMHVHAYVGTCLFFVNVYVCMCLHILSIRACMYLRSHANVCLLLLCMCVCVYVLMYVFMYRKTYLHTHTHTHAHERQTFNMPSSTQPQQSNINKASETKLQHEDATSEKPLKGTFLNQNFVNAGNDGRLLSAATTRGVRLCVCVCACVCMHA